MTLLTLLLIAILVALIVQIADARRRERYERQREQHHSDEQRRRELDEGGKPRRRVAVQVFKIGDKPGALDGEGRQWMWEDGRWWALDHLMLPQVEDDKAFQLLSLRYDDKVRDFLPAAKTRYDAASADSSWANMSRPGVEASAAIREFVAGLEEPEELHEALKRELERQFYIFLKRNENKGQS